MATSPKAENLMMSRCCGCMSEALGVLFLVEHRVGRRVVIHLHLPINLHVFPSRLDVVQQLVDGRREVLLLLQQYGKLVGSLLQMLFAGSCLKSHGNGEKNNQIYDHQTDILF